MKLSSGYPYSLIKNGLPYAYPKLEEDIRTDVVILGGGISGALTAHYLVHSGVECTVIDARTIGLGSTCASTSLLQYEIDTPLHKLINMIGLNSAVRSYRLGEKAIQKLIALGNRVGVDVKENQSLYYAAYKKDIEFIRKEFEARDKYGFRVNHLSENAIKDEFGFVAPAAILSDMAATVDSYLLTHQLLQYNISKGLKVYDRTSATSIQHTIRNVQLRTQEGFIIMAKKIVYATGYEAVNYISKPIVKLTSTYATACESFNGSIIFGKNNDAVIWNTAKPYLYMRTTDDNRIIIGGRDEDFFSHSKRDRLILQKTKQLQKDFKKLFPSVSFKPEFSWAGVFGSTKDGLPYIGTYKALPNSFFALGFGGNGITFSQIAGEVIADLVTGKRNRDLELFSFER